MEKMVFGRLFKRAKRVVRIEKAFSVYLSTTRQLVSLAVGTPEKTMVRETDSEWDTTENPLRRSQLRTGMAYIARDSSLAIANSHRRSTQSAVELSQQLCTVSILLHPTA